MRIRILLFSFFLPFFIFACASSEATTENVRKTAKSSSATLALVNGVLIDGTGSYPMNDAVIVINENRIVSVGSRSQVSCG